MPDIKEFYNLDFNDLKDQFKAFISEHTDFQDYNFEGSALSQLLDIITFGIQYQNMYLNMATNELFLETAQIDTNVFKLANTLNYIPKRKTAAYIWVGIQRNNDIENGELWTGAGDIVQPDPPDEWALATGVTDGVFTVEDDSANDSAHDGASAVLKIEQDTAGQKLISQAFATTIGKNYTFTVRYKTNGTQSGRVMISVANDIAGELLDSTVTSAVAGEWGQLTFNFTATNALTYFTLGGKDDVIGEHVMFDEARLTRNLSITIDKYSKFVMGSLNLTNFEDIIINDNEIHLVRLYEGDVNQQTWISDGTTFQEYVLNYRDEIDNEELNVFVDEPDGFGGFILGIDPWINVNTEPFELNDPGYYIQHFEDLRIQFDDGQRFQIPQVNDRVRIIYVKTQGAAVNGNAAQITIDSSVTFYDELTVTRLGVLENGADEESIDAIRINAPLYYTTQNRAVTQDDHNILVKRYGQFDTFFDAFLWGGELEFVEEAPVIPPTIPPSFYKRLVEFWPSKEFPFTDVGNVYVSALKDDFDYLNDTEIADLITFLDRTKIIAIFYKFLQPQIVHILPTVNIKHESVLNLDTVAIANQIDTWLNDNLEGFNKTFHLSNLIKFVDSIDEVIETSISFTSRVTVKDHPYVAVRLWNPVVPGSINGTVAGEPLVDDGAGNILWGTVPQIVGSITYTPPPTPQSAAQTGGFMIINQEDYVSFGLPANSTYDINFEYQSQRTVELNRESFMLFDPIILNAEKFTEIQ